ncbi:MAG: helix-turn-helix transcriptional regulator [Bacillota bacterium]
MYVENKVRQIRRMKDITQMKMAEDLGVARSTIIAIEQGQFEPSGRLMLLIAEYFSMSVEELFWLEGRETEHVQAKNKA